MSGSTVEQKLARPDVSGYLAVVTATVCWGTSGMFVKFIVADTDISALALAFWRDLLTFTTLLVGVGLLRPTWLRVQRRDLAWMAALGSVSVGTFHVLWNLSVLLNGVAVSTVQQAVMPVVVAIAAWLIWREPLTRRKIMAIALTFLGTLSISGLNVLGSAQLNVPGSGWLWLAALVGFSTILPFATYTFGLGRLPASVAAILSMTEIPVAYLYAHLLLGERLTIVQFAGAALVVGGVLLLSWPR